MGPSYHLLNLLLSLAPSFGQWQNMQPGQGEDQWLQHPYLQVPKERWGYNFSPDVNADCTAAFGPKPSGPWAGCTSYVPGENGLEAMINLPRRGLKPDLQEHEEKHAQGFVHPDQQILDEYSRQQGIK